MCRISLEGKVSCIGISGALNTVFKRYFSYFKTRSLDVYDIMSDSFV